MSAAERPKRHDFNFSMSDESKCRLDSLMARCGQDNLNLLVARGLALVAWVEDQCDLGRAVGSIFYGADEPDFRPLEERPELTRPPKRPHLVPVTVTQSSTVVEPDSVSGASAPDQEAITAAAAKPVGQVAERIPAEFNGQLKKPKPFRVPDRAPKSDMPAGYYKSPVRRLSELQDDAKMRNVPGPIDFKGQPLPAGLNQSHSQLLNDSLQQVGATHFRLMSDLHLVAYRYIARKGWCTHDPQRCRWAGDSWINSGMDAIYSIKTAQEYLASNHAPPPEPEAHEDVQF